MVANKRGDLDALNSALLAAEDVSVMASRSSSCSKFGFFVDNGRGDWLDLFSAPMAVRIDAAGELERLYVATLAAHDTSTKEARDATKKVLDWLRQAR